MLLQSLGRTTRSKVINEALFKTFGLGAILFTLMVKVSMQFLVTSSRLQGDHD